MEEKLEQIKERVTEQKSKAITMSRVPIQDYNWFVDFAKEFADDYGMALKKLIDVTREMYPPNNISLILMRLEEFEERITELEQKKEIEPEQKFKTIKTVGGKEIKVMEREQ